jgi:hypothetical protein
LNIENDIGMNDPEPRGGISPEPGMPILASGQEVAPTPTPVRRRRPDLATLPDVRREMARVYREMRLQKIPCADGTRLAYVLTSIGKMIESGDLLARLEALEAAAAGKRH